MLKVIEKRNGDRAIFAQIPDVERVALVTLQKDGEIRWASVGPMAPAHAKEFSDAVRLALHLSAFSTESGLTWRVVDEQLVNAQSNRP
jgi:hypothetical protein